MFYALHSATRNIGSRHQSSQRQLPRQMNGCNRAGPGGDDEGALERECVAALHSATHEVGLFKDIVNLKDN